jgi:hypothetical protein
MKGKIVFHERYWKNVSQTGEWTIPLLDHAACWIVEWRI